MQAWRVLIALSFLLLSGCLVAFKEPLPAAQAAPAQLLGKWASKNAWGEPLNIQLSQIGANRYREPRTWKNWQVPCSRICWCERTSCARRGLSKASWRKACSAIRCSRRVSNWRRT